MFRVQIGKYSSKVKRKLPMGLSGDNLPDNHFTSHSESTEKSKQITDFVNRYILFDSQMRWLI